MSTLYAYFNTMIMIKQCSHITGFDPGDFWEFISELLMCTKTFCWTGEIRAHGAKSFLHSALCVNNRN